MSTCVKCVTCRRRGYLYRERAPNRMTCPSCKGSGHVSVGRGLALARVRDSVRAINERRPPSHDATAHALALEMMAYATATRRTVTGGAAWTAAAETAETSYRKAIRACA